MELMQIAFWHNQTDIIKHIQELSRDIQLHSEAWVIPVYSEPAIFGTVVNLRPPGIFRALAYSEPSYIRNPGIFKILAYAELWLNQSRDIVKNLAYSEPWNI